MVEEYERVQESNVENTTERIHASPPRSTAASASGVTVDNHDNDDQEETRKLVESSNSGGDAQEEEKEENEEYENPEHDLPATAVVVSRDAEANRVVSPIARQASSDDEDNDYLHAHGSGGEYFEDEPEDRLPKASPKRLAARLERRKQARKQKQFQQQEKHAPRPSKASLGLPKFEPLPKPLDQDDDESSHWSSSDGELVDEERKGAAWLSKDDIEICKRLDEEYERALEEREVVYAARYNSVRQSACFSVFFMLFYLALGTYFFTRQTNWTVPESVLFSIYTITTVGCKLNVSKSKVSSPCRQSNDCLVTTRKRRSSPSSPNTCVSTLHYFLYLHRHCWYYPHGGTDVSVYRLRGQQSRTRSRASQTRGT